MNADMDKIASLQTNATAAKLLLEARPAKSTPGATVLVGEMYHDPNKGT